MFGYNKKSDLNTIKENVKNLKRNRQHVKYLVFKLNENYDTLIEENQDNKKMLLFDKNLKIDELYLIYGNGMLFSFVYKNGEKIVFTGNQVVDGTVKPKLRGIKYAYYSDNYSEMTWSK